MIRYLWISFLIAISIGIVPHYAQEQLTLRELFTRVEQENAELQASKIAIQTAMAKEEQADVRPNPYLQLNAQNIFGTAPEQGLDSAQTTIMVSEKVERGQKRQARLTLAEGNTKQVALEYDIRKQTLLLEAFERYIDVISEGQRLAISKQNYHIYERFSQAVTRQVTSGRLPQAEQTRSEIQWIQAGLEIEKINHAYKENLSRLRMLYNETGHLSSLDVESLPVPSHNLEELKAHSEGFLQANKQYQRFLLSKDQANRRVAFEVSRGKQDPTFTAGLKHDNSLEAASFVANIGIPLPVFNQNKGNIEAALFKEQEWNVLEQTYKNELTVTYEHRFHHAHLLQEEIDVLIEHIIPKTKHVYEQVEQGYLQGKYAYLDVLNSQQEWIKAQESLVAVLGDYWKTVASLEIILGHSLEHQLPQLFEQTKETTHD